MKHVTQLRCLESQVSLLDDDGERHAKVKRSTTGHIAFLVDTPDGDFVMTPGIAGRLASELWRLAWGK